MSSQSEPKTSSSTQETSQVSTNATCLLTPNVSLRPGMLCPRCGNGLMDYNGLLQLVCPNCGLTEAGACT